MLAEKVLFKNIDIKNTVKLTIHRENSKASVNAVTGRAENGVMRLQGGSRYKQQGARNSDDQSLTIDNMKRQLMRLNVLKEQKHGKYSSRYKSESDEGE